jgi:hypothetical protein
MVTESSVPAPDLAAVAAQELRLVADAADRVRQVDGHMPLASKSLMTELAAEADLGGPIPGVRNLSWQRATLQ